MSTSQVISTTELVGFRFLATALLAVIAALQLVFRGGSERTCKTGPRRTLAVAAERLRTMIAPLLQLTGRQIRLLLADRAAACAVLMVPRCAPPGLCPPPRCSAANSVGQRKTLLA